MRKFKASAVLLLSSLLLPQIVAPASAYALSNDISNKIEIVASYDSEIPDVKVEAVNDTTVQITNEDGTVDVMERRSDGVYLNGSFYMPLMDTPTSNGVSFRSAHTLNRWYYVGTSQGTAEGAANANGLAHSVIGLLLGLGWNPVGIAYSIGAILVSMIAPSAPGAYYKTTLYVHPQNRQFKTVTSYYKNANYTGYVTTVTRYSNF